MLSDFYSDLRSLANDQDVFIYSDSVEASSATNHNFQWLSVSETSQNELIDSVLLRTHSKLRKEPA
jgi:hypothetical protein